MSCLLLPLPFTDFLLKNSACYLCCPMNLLFLIFPSAFHVDISSCLSHVLHSTDMQNVHSNFPLSETEIPLWHYSLRFHAIPRSSRSVHLHLPLVFSEIYGYTFILLLANSVSILFLTCISFILAVIVFIYVLMKLNALHFNL